MWRKLGKRQNIQNKCVKAEVKNLLSNNIDTNYFTTISQTADMILIVFKLSLININVMLMVDLYYN